MADAELTVRISGDTSDLEGAIGRVESQLSKLEKSDGSNVGKDMEKGVKSAADRLEQTSKKLKSLGEGVDSATKPFQAVGAAELTEFANVSGKTTKEFAESWKNDASGTFKDFVDGLSKSSDIVGELKNLGFDNIRDLQALQKLAGPQGIQLLTEALQRSNNAWEENTALVNKFENKAGTTASQIQIMKNNLVETGRSLGEAFQPTINNGVTDIKEFAQGIANMSDGQKQALITTGKWIIGIGAMGKVTSGALKSTGNVIDGISKIRKATEAGGVSEMSLGVPDEISADIRH